MTLVSFPVRTRLSPGREHRPYISMIRVWESLPLQGQPRGIYRLPRKRDSEPRIRLQVPLSTRHPPKPLGLISHCLTPNSCLLIDTIGEVVINTTTNPESRHGDRLE